MAGGEGTRFQPLSTPARPKQFINIVGTKSLIRQTFERVASLGVENNFDNFYVATNVRYVSLVKKELPEIPFENIIGEPVKKNTAPCIGFVAHLIAAKDPEAVMVCLPSDHVILKPGVFLKILDSAVDVAVQHKMLVTLGIAPTRPATEYGYIERGGAVGGNFKHGVYVVKKFTEKPDEELATGYIASGNYSWNSGMFVWGAATILDEMSRHAPQIANEVSRLRRHVEMPMLVNFFDNVPNISIDYGVMEKSRNTAVIPCEFAWSDIGSWKGLKEIYDSHAVEITPEVKKIMEEQLA